MPVIRELDARLLAAADDLTGMFFRVTGRDHYYLAGLLAYCLVPLLFFCMAGMAFARADSLVIWPGIFARAFIATVLIFALHRLKAEAGKRETSAFPDRTLERKLLSLRFYSLFIAAIVMLSDIPVVIGLSRPLFTPHGPELMFFDIAVLGLIASSYCISLSRDAP